MVELEPTYCLIKEETVHKLANVLVDYMNLLDQNDYNVPSELIEISFELFRATNHG